MKKEGLAAYLKKALPELSQNSEADYFAEKVFEFSKRTQSYPNLVYGYELEKYAAAFKRARKDYGLSFNPFFGELAVFPQGGELKTPPMHKGVLRLIQRSDLNVRVVTDYVLEGETVEDIEAREPIFRHHKLPIRNEAEWLYFYCVVYFPDGTHVIERVDRAGFEKLRTMAKAANIWEKFPIEMGRKSAFLKASKWLDINPSNPKNTALIAAISDEKIDFEADVRTEEQNAAETLKAEMNDALGRMTAAKDKTPLQRVMLLMTDFELFVKHGNAKQKESALKQVEKALAAADEKEAGGCICADCRA